MTGFNSKRDAAADKLQEPVLAPAPGYCKNCKDYTIEEPLYAQPAQEPTGMLHIERLDKWLDASLKERKQREWVGLTDEEMESTFIKCGGYWNDDFWKIEDADFHPFLRTIEAKLKEKNT
jgi:hypothetical protein